MGLVSELRRRNVLRMAVLYGVTAWLIMQVAEVLIGLANLPEWIGPALLSVLAIGFPIALVFSWVYEITPEGLKLEKDIERSDSIAHITGRRMDFIVIAIMAAALIVFSYDKWWLSVEKDVFLPPANSIAVLAFDNMSSDPEQEYFSDGISEELLNLLAQMPELRVVARSSSFSFKDEKVDIATVAKQLNVRHVVEGSVRRSGDEMRITAQLIDSTDSTHIWSQTYDRKLTDIFAVQDEISAAIVGALKEKLGLQVEAVPRVVAAANTEAYEAYLRGRYLVVQRTLPNIEGAIREFEKAIALDSDYALGHAELALATLLLATFSDLTNIEAVAMATPHAERAMTLDPTLAEAHAATGYVFWLQGGLEEALTHFRQAIQINPNYSDVYHWMANLFNGDLGRYAESFAMREMAVRLDPLSVAAFVYFWELMARNRVDEAERNMKKLEFSGPLRYALMQASLGLKSPGIRSASARWVLALLDAVRIDPESIIIWNRLAMPFALLGLEKEALAISEGKGLAHAYTLIMLGRSGDALAIAEARLADDPLLSIDSPIRGVALAGAGDYDRARPILEEAWQLSGGRLTSRYRFHHYQAVALIAILRDAGEEAGVAELVAAMRDNVRRYREAGINRANYADSADYEEGLADFLTGERERGLALMAKGAEDGYFIPPNQAYLQVLYDDPGFAPILAAQEARQTREREKFLAIVCTDNPYAAVWKPEEGTCEGFAAAGGN